ncbi:bacterial transferase hexapeptide repeat-containing protein [Nannochloropsis oceanica]
MKGGSSGSGDVQKEEDWLQAIVLADSFTGTFRPCSLDKPKVLLPLLNVPMLDYVMEFLVAAGVQEVFIFCVNRKEDVQQYMARSKWPSSVVLRCISSAKCMGAGDALREMDSLGLIRTNPFVLISGDVVSTVNLAAVVAAHKRRKAENSLSICTVVMAKVGYEASVHARREDLVVGLDAATAQLVLYEDDEGTEGGVGVGLDLFKEEGHPEMVLRNDLMDCHIYVCSPEVLVAFSDNWDYQDMARYLHQEVQNREMGNRLFAHVTLPSEYAARVHDPHVYHAVAQDLLHRWLYPSVPETNNILAGELTSYRYHKRWLYREETNEAEAYEDGNRAASKGVHVSRFATVSKTVMLGQGTSIGAGSVLGRSVLGRQVKVGANVRITDSHLWHDVVVEDGAVVESSILSDGVKVMAGAVVGKGSLLSFGVVVGRGVVLPPYSRLTATASSTWGEDEFLGGGTSVASPPKRRGSSVGGGEEETSRDISAQAGSAAGDGEMLTDPTVVGVDGKGRRWVPLFDGECISEADLRVQSIGAAEEDEGRRRRWEMLDEEEKEEEEFLLEEDGDMGGIGGGGLGGGFMDMSSAYNGAGTESFGIGRRGVGGVGGIGSGVHDLGAMGGGNGLANRTTDDEFTHVVRDLIISGYFSRHAVSNLLLEVKSFKFAQNRSFAAVMRAVAPALLDLALDPDGMRRQAEEAASPPRRIGGVEGVRLRSRSRSGSVDGNVGAETGAGGVPAAPDLLSEQAAITNIKAQLNHWESLLRAVNQEPEVEEALLEATQAYALREEEVGNGVQNGRRTSSRVLYDIFGLVLLTFVNEDVLSPATAVAWADACSSSSSDMNKKAAALFYEARTQKFVKWVRNLDAEESSSSGEEESDSEEDDEE